MFFVPLHCSALGECGVQTSSVPSNVYFFLDNNTEQADWPISTHLPNQMTLSVVCTIFNTKQHVVGNNNISKLLEVRVSEGAPLIWYFDVMLKWNDIKLKTIETPSHHISNVLCKQQTYHNVIIQIFADNRPWWNSRAAGLAICCYVQSDTEGLQLATRAVTAR